MSPRVVLRMSRQVIWMAAIWIMSVSVLAVVAGFLRVVMSAAGMTS